MDNATWVQILGGVALFITSIGALISSLRTNNKVKQSAEAKKKEAADAAQVIVDAAADQVKIIREEADRVRKHLRLEQEESGKWKDHCESLDGKMRALTIRVEGAESCQSEMTMKIKNLEEEKKSLQDQVTKLTEQVEALQEENKRLKEERDIEKGLIA